MEDEAVVVVKKNEVINGQLVEKLVGRAREQGIALTGAGGLPGPLTKLVLKSALDSEVTEHLSYDKHERAEWATNARTGSRTKTALTDIGHRFSLN